MERPKVRQLVDPNHLEGSTGVRAAGAFHFEARPAAGAAFSRYGDPRPRVRWVGREPERCGGGSESLIPVGQDLGAPS